MNKNKNRIKILICTHKPTSYIENQYLEPIHIGAEGKKSIGIRLRDNRGDNRSYRDIEYGELTAQYWAWRNCNAEYVGFMHYRRYFNFTEISYPVDGWGNIYEKELNSSCIGKFGLDENTIAWCIGDNDIITAPMLDLHNLPSHKNSVIDQYEDNEYMVGKSKDILALLDIINEICPEYYQFAYRFFFGHRMCFCNMFIMRKEIFDRYCEWLFRVLDEFERRVDTRNYSKYASRTPGLLAERLLNVFILYEKSRNKSLKVKELQSVFFERTDAEENKLKRAYDNNCVTIFTSSGNQFVPFVSVWLQSILEYASTKHNYDIIILEEAISKENKRILKQMAAEYNNFSIRFFDVAKELSDLSFENWNHTNRLTYARFLIPSICTYTEKAIWLDSDIVVKRDIFELNQVDVENFYLAAARDIRALGELNDPKDPQMHNFTKILKLKNPYDYFQAGVMVLNVQKIGTDFSKELLLKESQRKDLRWLDQDVLNLLCQGKVTYLPQKWNYVVPAHIPIEEYAPVPLKQEWESAKKDPWIIHYAGKRQPVYVRNVEFFEQFWEVARHTPYYETLLMLTITNSQTTSYNPPPLPYRSGARIWADKWLPIGSKRRAIAKKILPKGTKRWEFFRNIYNKVIGIR